VPAGELAKAAVAANPEMSNRAIAEKIGVGKDSVRRARTGAKAPVEKRVGKDGKARKQPVARAKKPAPSHQQLAESPAAWRTRVANVTTLVDKIIEATNITLMAVDYADLKTCPKTPQMLRAIDTAIARWSKLRATLKKEMEK